MTDDFSSTGANRGNGGWGPSALFNSIDSKIKAKESSKICLKIPLFGTLRYLLLNSLPLPPKNSSLACLAPWRFEIFFFSSIHDPQYQARDRKGLAEVVRKERRDHKNLPGLRIPLGSSACFSAWWMSKDTSPMAWRHQRFLARPTPCSPVMVPP